MKYNKFADQSVSEKAWGVIQVYAICIYALSLHKNGTKK